MAGAWRVRDVVAHLLDTALRRLAFHRDGAVPGDRRSPRGGSLRVVGAHAPDALAVRLGRH